MQENTNIERPNITANALAMQADPLSAENVQAAARATQALAEEARNNMSSYAVENLDPTSKKILNIGETAIRNALPAASAPTPTPNIITIPADDVRETRPGVTSGGQ